MLTKNQAFILESILIEAHESQGMSVSEYAACSTKTDYSNITDAERDIKKLESYKLLESDNLSEYLVTESGESILARVRILYAISSFSDGDCYSHTEISNKLSEYGCEIEIYEILFELENLYRDDLITGVRSSNQRGDKCLIDIRLSPKGYFSLSKPNRLWGQQMPESPNFSTNITADTIHAAAINTGGGDNVNSTQNINSGLPSKALSDILASIKSLRILAESLPAEHYDDAIEVIDGVLEDFSSDDIQPKTVKKSLRSFAGFIIPLGTALWTGANGMLDVSSKTVKFIGESIDVIDKSVDLIEKIEEKQVDIKMFLPDDFRQKFNNP